MMLNYVVYNKLNRIEEFCVKWIIILLTIALHIKFLLTNGEEQWSPDPLNVGDNKQKIFSINTTEINNITLLRNQQK